MKKIVVLTAMLFAIMLMGVCAYADDLSITTDSTLPSGVANSEYSAKIEAAGGTAPYTFALVNPTYAPKGITMDTSGNLSGIPTSGGHTYSGIEIRVTDADNNTATKIFSIAVYARQVKFEIGENSFTFDNMPHKIDESEITAKVGSQDVTSLIDYVITYGGEETQTAVGSYPIKIVVNTPGYVYGKKTKNTLNITKNNDVKITFAGDVEYAYDSVQHSPTRTVQGRYTPEAEYADISHSVIYEGITVNYPESSTAPSMPGVYRMTVLVTDENFTTPENNSITFEILHNTVNFTLDDQTPFYQGDTWNRSYTADRTLTKPFTVEYVKDGTAYSAPVTGTYTVRITIDDDDSTLYSVGTITPSTITVQQHGVSFNVTNTTKQYTSAGLSPDIVETEYNLQPVTDYTVVFTNDDTTDTTVYDLSNLPVNSGTYTYTIALAAGSPYSTPPVTGKFIITPVNVKFTLSPATFTYDNTEKTPALTTDPADLDSSLYTIKYKLDGTEKPIQSVGDYTVEYLLTDTKNYTVHDDSTTIVSVTENQIDFNVTAPSFVYGDGADHKATVTATDSESNPFTGFTVTYTNQDTTDTKTYTDSDLPVNAGTYNIVITLNDDGYAKGTVTGPQVLTISKRDISFATTKNEFDYNGSDIDPSSYITMTPTLTGVPYTLVYHLQGETADLAALRDAGVYTVEIRFSEQDAKNYNVTSTIGNLEVKKKAVDFTITNSSPFTYNKTGRYVSVAATVQGGGPFANYSVKYVNRDTTDTSVYNESNLPQNAGTYDVVITVNDDGYVIGTVTGSTELVINQAEITFSVTDRLYDYDEQPHTATVTTVPAVDDGTFTVSYQKQGSVDHAVTEATDAGTYDIALTITNPNYIRAAADTASHTLLINKREVTFNVTKASADWNGSGQNAELTMNDLPDGLTKPTFTHTYKNQDTTDTKEYTTSDAPVNAGVYDIKISVPDNYTVAGGPYTFTINSAILVPYGNSPAAMIYKDSTHANDADWQDAALAAFKTNRHFTVEYLPAGCDASIEYPLINGDDTLDFDSNPYTQIVGTNEEYIDLGAYKDGNLIMGEMPTATSIDGLYRVSYLDEDNEEIAWRYVVEIDKLGDANSDGVVNVIDANGIANYVKDSTTVDSTVKARSWDINKDGMITNADIDAILNRFRVKLKPYYPWLVI